MGCPIPSMSILLADGSKKPAGELKVGDTLDTLHEVTLKRGKHKVTYVETIDSEVLLLNFSGQIFQCSPTHKFHFANKKNWVEAQDLKPGDKVYLLDGETEFTEGEQLDDGQVVVIKVDKAHTYICDGILSHNKGNTTYHAPPPPPPDTTFQDYLKAQEKREKRGEYRNWLGDVQEYKSAKGKQASGRAGWSDFKTGVQSQLGSGLLSFDEAKGQLANYATKYNLASNSILAPHADPRGDWGDDSETTDVPTYETPDEWQNWSVAGAQNELQKYYSGEDGTGGIRGARRTTGIGAAYQDLLGRDATAAELTSAQERFAGGYYKDIADVKDTIKSSGEYTDKFQSSYIDNYYDTMYGDELRDSGGKRTGKRKFEFDANKYMPKYDGDLKKSTGISTPDYEDSYEGTPASIDAYLDSIRDTRKYLYSAGLTNLQGDIDTETQKLKNEGGREITRIGKEGDIYSSVVNSFNF